ncbi:MAG: Septum formation initiator [Gemmatimonadetes bacterium]|nr:Septum formation initiator [Gemmatimonadota bacterium]
MATKKKSSSGAQRIKQVLIGVGVIAALVFAVQGGEYGTRDLMRQRARKRTLVSTIDSLQHVVDSLKRYKRRVETDPALQERIAREEFGMVRGSKELLYRFAEPDSATRAP